VTARERMLATIRAALADVPAGEPGAWDPGTDDDPATAYTRNRPVDRQGLIELFAERCGAYRATVVHCPAHDQAIAEAARQACRRHDVHSLAVPGGLPAGWLPAEIPARPDDPPLSLSELDGGVAALTGCALAVALTGTIVLDAGPEQGRRVLSLIPDVHVCVVRAEQIVYGVPEAIGALAPAVLQSRRALTLISGPSATSDIELQRVEGVHGPRQLEVILTHERG
jgi:L-lactate dehydrogenase complex protein LldG